MDKHDRIIINIKSDVRYSSLLISNIGPFNIIENISERGILPGFHRTDDDKQISLCRNIETFRYYSYVYPEDINDGEVTDDYLFRRSYGFYVPGYLNDKNKSPIGYYFDGKIVNLDAGETYIFHYYRHIVINMELYNDIIKYDTINVIGDDISSKLLRRILSEDRDNTS